MVEEIKLEDRLGIEYTNHLVFEQLDYYAKFYESLSFSIMPFMSRGTVSIMNINTYILSSIKCTVESIKDILKKGRVSDTYALIRKYYDSTITNIYIDLYLANNWRSGNHVVEKIHKWLRGKEKMPFYDEMCVYIKTTPEKNVPDLSIIYNLLHKDDKYKNIREKCNDNMHYNSYNNYLLNDNEIHVPDRERHLDIITESMEALFIQHFAYMFYLNDHYMMSSYHIDCLEIAVEPEYGSQYWVADFIQEVFDKIIKIKRPDIAQALKENTNMELLF